jgi:malate synthase
VTRDLVERLVEEEYAGLRERLGAEAFDAGHWAEARRLFVESALSEEFPDFLTLPAYRSVLAAE